MLTEKIRRWGALLALLVAAQCAWAASTPERIRALAADYAHASRAAAAPFDERAWLERFYGARDYAPAWTGATAPLAAQALALLSQADEHGLPAADYDPRALAERMRAHAGAPDQEADRDAALTLALLRYLADLHTGRIRSEFGPAPASDPVLLLQQGLAQRNLAAAVAAAEPRLALYQRLKATLAQYRKLAAQPATLLPPLPRAPEAGAAYAGARALAARLALLGDLPADLAGTPTDTYSAELTQAVQRFQDRHGLEADGKLGPQTLAALNVPLAARVRQIELSLERLRGLPNLSAGPFIAVNLPSFRLWAFSSAGTAPVLATRVIVGKAVRTQTPLFVGTLRYVEFNPYWNVPPSILQAEILPALLRDPNYLVKNDMEVAGAGVQAVDAATMAALRAGKLRVRQRPGPKNALGAIKFGLPNKMNIYLHSTPARALFARSRRDFSHGCIRVEDTVALANFVLGKQAGWTADAIDAAMAPGPNRTVQLAASMPVVMFYTTAIVDVDGRPLFPADIYGLDGVLERSLASRAAR